MVTPDQDMYDIIGDGESQWVFDYLNALYGEDYDGGYFWQIVNGGNKLVKVRFYPV